MHVLSVGLLVGAVVLLVAFVEGQRINRALARWVAHELERFFRVEGGTYTWLGGVMGFEARLYGRMGPVHAVVTFLPRHALLYYPVARFLTSKGDRIRVVCQGQTFTFVGRLHREGDRKAFQHALQRFTEALRVFPPEGTEGGRSGDAPL